jgi:hypothetical protein
LSRKLGQANCRSFGCAPYEQKRLPVKLDARRGNSRSLHFATPDFLWDLVASANFMRLSLRKGAYAVLSSAAWQEIRVRSGRDGNSFFHTYIPHGQPSRCSFQTQLAARRVRLLLMTRRVGVRSNPTQAKRRLEWATPKFSCGWGQPCHFLGMTKGREARFHHLG